MIIFFMISPPSCMDLIEKCLFLDSILWRGESGHTEMQAQAGLAYAGPINNQNAVNTAEKMPRIQTQIQQSFQSLDCDIKWGTKNGTITSILHPIVPRLFPSQNKLVKKK